MSTSLEYASKLYEEISNMQPSDKKIFDKIFFDKLYSVEAAIQREKDHKKLLASVKIALCFGIPCESVLEESSILTELLEEKFPKKVRTFKLEDKDIKFDDDEFGVFISDVRNMPSSPAERKKYLNQVKCFLTLQPRKCRAIVIYLVDTTIKIDTYGVWFTFNYTVKNLNKNLFEDIANTIFNYSTLNNGYPYMGPNYDPNEDPYCQDNYVQCNDYDDIFDPTKY